MNVSETLKWLEKEADRLFEECNSNTDPYKSINNSFLEGFNYAVANVEALELPQLNENQQTILDELKINTDYQKFNKFQAVFWLLTTFIQDPYTLLAKAYKELTRDELDQIFQEFSQWTLGQEEE